MLKKNKNFFKKIHNSDINTLPLEDLYGMPAKEELSEKKSNTFNLEYFLKDEEYYSFSNKKLCYYLTTSRIRNTRIAPTIRKKKLEDFKHFTVETYLKKLINNFTYFNNIIDYNCFNYFFINENRRQSFVSILNENKVSELTYSTGLVLCALGFKKNNMYKTLKKQHKGFLKCFNYSKNLILPKLIRKFNRDENQMGIVLTGRGKFTKNYIELPNYLESIKVKVIFLL